ncbi:MAG: S8 family serine peptidase [candidate division Zixibacteria bacterium]|nr:S8 family serine peptidase [candidate division Zixibacteria bacterium]
MLALIGPLLLAAPILPQTTPSGPIPGRFVVKLAPRISATHISQALSDGQRLTRPSQLLVDDRLSGASQWDRVYILHTEDHNLTADQLRQQIGTDNVEYVEPDYYLEFFDYPTDSHFEHQWYLNNTGQDYWAVDRLDGIMNDSLALRHGNPGHDIGVAYYYENQPTLTTKVVVAVIDTGVDPTHPELQGRLWRNPDEIPGNNIDDDHNGFIDDTLGYDVSGDSLTLFDVVGDNDPTDIIGHGTHLAGIIVANHDQTGIAGIASSAEIMAVKIRPNGTTVVGAMGIVYAVNAGANVLNISWGTPFETLILLDAVRFARDNGVLVCVSSGNSGDARLYYPAAFDESFTVGAANSSGNVTYFSTYGSHLDLVAPGQNILSLRAAGTDMYAGANEPDVHIVGDNDNYYLADGTSMAAPMVAGAAALIWSIRPQLTLDQLEFDLLHGARDIVDPFGLGDSLPGPDSLSGYGHLDIRGTLELIRNGGIFFVSPEPHNRYLNSIEIKATTVGGYLGGWALAYATSVVPNTWHQLAVGSSVPTDSVLFVLSDPALSGHLTLRLTDDFGAERFVKAILVSDMHLEISSPQPGATYDYNVPISGSIYGPGYHSTAVYYRSNGGPRILLTETSGEYFDSLIYSWNASGIPLGDYTIYLEADFETGVLSDSVTFELASAFAQGWPQELSGRGGLSAMAVDLNNGGTKEIVVGTTFGLQVFGANGQIVDGFPALIDTAVRCVPAAYDVDHDGRPEIICTSDSAIHVFNYDGTTVPGWPVKANLGHTSYGSPTPTVAEMNSDGDSAILVIDRDGNVLAYEFDGTSYFYSLEGWFTSFNLEPIGSVYINNNTISSADLNGDNYNEIVVSHSSELPYSGVAIFEGRTGQPALGRSLPYTIEVSGLYGTILADLTGDKLPEIVTSGYDLTGAMHLWVKTDGFDNLPGWPITLPDVEDWIGVYPSVADLDLDGIPEVLAIYYEFDIGVLYVFRADGTPYITLEGRPPGEAFRYAATLGTPIVADLLDDAHPEVVIRSGRIFPGSGREAVHILDHTLTPIPGWPILTPTQPAQVFSTPYAPMVDDVDGDGLVELVLVGEGMTVFVWDFDASAAEGTNHGRMFVDNLNSGVVDPNQIVTDVDDTPAQIPRRFVLEQNYPNPFNPTTAISFATPSRQMVTLEIFNVLGQKVTTLVDQVLPAGQHTIEFDGSQCASGVYLYRLRADSETLTHKMVLIK